MLPSGLLKILKKLPQRDEVWVGDRRPSGARVEDAGPIDGIIWLDRATGLVRSGTMTRGDDGPEALLEALLEAMRHPVSGCVPARPREVAVREPAMRDFLSDALKPLRISVQLYSECAPLDAVFAGMERHMTGPDLSYLDREEVSPELVGQLFEAAAEWAEIEPWEEIFDSQPFRLEGLKPGPLVASILGHAGVEHGLAIYLTEQAARTMLAGGSRSLLVQQPVLTLTYAEEGNLGPRYAEDVQRHGWRVDAPEWHPLLARFDREEQAFLATADEIRLALEVMEALTLYLHHDASRSGGKRTVRLAGGKKVKVEWPVRLSRDGSASAEEWEEPVAEEVLEELAEYGVEPKREWFEQRPPECVSALDLARRHRADAEALPEVVDALRVLWELWLPRDACVETRYERLHEEPPGLEPGTALKYLDGMQALVEWAAGCGQEAQMAAALEGFEPEGILRAFVGLGSDASAEDRARRWLARAKLWPVLGALEGLLRRREGRTVEAARIFDRISRLKDVGYALPLLCGSELLRGAESRDKKLLRQAEWYLARAEQRLDEDDFAMIRLACEGLAELYERTGKPAKAQQYRDRVAAVSD